MPYSAARRHGLNRGFKRYKYRCHEQVRLAYNGLGAEWYHNYLRDELCARMDNPDRSRAIEHEGHEEVPDFHRTGTDFWGRGGERDCQGSYLIRFEETAVRNNDWHRRRTDGCVEPDQVDEDWIDD